MKVFLIGGRNVAYHLARRLLNKGYQVVLVNKDEKLNEELAKRLKKAIVITGDGSKRHVLEQLEITSVDLFVALTPNDQDNLVACLIAKRVFGIENPLALINDPDNEIAFKKLGIETVVSPTNILAQAIEDRMFKQQITNLIPTSEQVSVFRIEMEEQSPAVGKRVMDLSIPRESVIGAIIRRGEVIIPRGDTVIENGDRLIVLSKPTVQSSVFESLLGEV
ncbi:NAD-binding protein [Kosmotoga pacifica]|uniref:Trk system potassium uptake protein TrkA n=1 Tax=Kosmotoga pacifica TaxID=1330330 RepID=A0A0G2ZFR5_9BACT|nr:NAD-binding protein [Kosmotoga pacifica]AKI97628.1 potassium transporter TrkA [Kosmotoga pacifica]